MHHPGRQRRLLASLAESGQQTPIVVVAVVGQPDRYVVIDGHKRITAISRSGCRASAEFSALTYRVGLIRRLRDTGVTGTCVTISHRNWI